MKLGYGSGAIAEYPWHIDGTKPWTEVDQAHAEECLRALPTLGIEWVDTAHRYGGGLSEELIGRVCTSETKVITKVELGPRTEMEKQIELSRKRLGRTPDVILLHNADFRQKIAIREAISLLADSALVCGLSTEPVVEAIPFLEDDKVGAIEFPYSKWDKRAEDSLFRAIKFKKGVLSIANRVLGGPRLRHKLHPFLVYDALAFVHDKSEIIDLALIGTTNMGHLSECSQIMAKLNGAD